MLKAGVEPWQVAPPSSGSRDGNRTDSSIDNYNGFTLHLNQRRQVKAIRDFGAQTNTMVDFNNDGIPDMFYGVLFGGQLLRNKAEGGALTEEPFAYGILYKDGRTGEHKEHLVWRNQVCPP